MKKFLFIILLNFTVNALFAQIKETFTDGGVIISTDFNETRPIREIFAEHPADTSRWHKVKESGDRSHRISQKFPMTVEDGPQYGNDERTLQTKMGEIPGRAPIANWAGQSVTGFRPMDPSGAAGPSHYVQMINATTFKIFNKTTGANILTGSLGNLWSPATANNGDPIVMYDKAADRWFLAQFGSTADRKIYIAVSTTNDPTGSYYTYTYTSPVFPDYLKFSVWADGYYMTSNQSPQKVFCFNRAEILAGTVGARSIFINFSPPQSGFFCPLPGDAADGVLPTLGAPCPIFSYSDNGWGGTFVDAINIYQMSVNWAPTTPTATITLAANLSPAAFDASYDVNWDDVSQPGTTQKLDGIGGVFMYRAQWKSWGGYNTIILNWGVKISATQRSIKWCELRQNQSTNVWSIFQEGTYTPDTDTRWMGGIAMDNNGSIGLSYMKSNSTSIFPGLYYAGRRSCDPLGTLPIAESVAIAGLGSQTGGINRVGDYAHTSLDPDGITFWHTSEYLGSGGAAKTQIFSYQLASCGTNASVSIVQTAGTNPQCPGASATFTASPFNGGTTPVYQWQVNGGNVGTNSTTYTTTSLTSGQIVTCIMTSNLPGVTGNPATSNGITMVVNPVVTPSVSIALTSGTNPACAGVSLTFTATPTNGGTTPSYQWKVNGSNAGTNSSTFTTNSLTNGQTVTCVLTSSALCVTSSTATSNGITVTITSLINPTVSILQTAGPNPLCTGASATFTATVSNGSSPVYQWKVSGGNVGTNSPTYTTSSLTNGQIVSCDITATPNCPSILNVQLGATMTANPTTGANADLGNPYPTYYGHGRQQYLIRASELTALGMTAGNINSIGFNVAGTTGDPATMIGYTIKMGTSVATVTTTTFLVPSPAFTTVFGPVNYTPTLSSINTHTFSSPYVWNGSSNILMDICFSNASVVGTIAYQVYQSTPSPSFSATTFYQVDGAASNVCIQTTGTTGTKRPNFYISSGSSTMGASSNQLTMSVNSTATPIVAVALTAGTNPQCTGASSTFTATPTNGGTTPAYQWKVNGGNVGSNSPTFGPTTLSNGQIVTCTMTSNLVCASPTTATSTGYTMTVNPSVTPSLGIGITSGSNPQCAGASVTFTVTPNNGGTTPSYQWKINGGNVGTNSVNFTTSTLTNGQVVSCVMTSNAPCASPITGTSNNITMVVNPVVSPSISIAITSGTNPGCNGISVTFTATPTNGGTTPSYQWLVDNVNAGTNSTTFSSSTLANGQVVKCILTSNANCLSTATATSNEITQTINEFVTPSVTIVASLPNICGGSSLTFTASPTNGGVNPSYQWKKNGTNVGVDNSSYTDNALLVGDVISCVLTSNASCLTTPTANSNNLTMTCAQPGSVTLNLKFFIAGFYSGGGMMEVGGAGALNILDMSDPMYSSDPTDVDDITISAMDETSYLLVESKVGRLKTNGNVSVTFTGPVSIGNSYFIKLTSRNLVETWSSNPVPFLSLTSYDFTSVSSKAYDDGSLPMLEVEPGIWACFNGDVDQDGAVTSLDMTLEENATNVGGFGYFVTDLDGDGGNTSLDMTIIETNTNKGVFSAHP